MKTLLTIMVAGVAGSVPIAGAFAVAGDGIRFSPHRAVYDITLQQSVAGSGVSELNGRMVYELSGSACDGFSQNMRFVTRIADEDGSTQVNDLRTSSWEAARGKRLRFSLNQYHNDQLAEATEGDAGRTGPDRSRVDVRLKKPTRKKVSLKPGVVFPMQHSRGLMRAAKDGKRVYSANLFDGSEKGERFYFTSAVIGNARSETVNPVRLPDKIGASLRGRTAWPISIGYFDPDKTTADAVPSYELSFMYFDNGVSTSLMIDYGDFSIRGKLAELQMLPVAECDAP
ncbi:MAG: cell envelope integrity EipB family protein [Pseudomonadota bacterium]